MLRPAYNWIETERGAYLRFNYRMVANVKPKGVGYEVTIHWCEYEHTGAVGSLAQGERFIERWVEKRRGFPIRREAASA